MANSAAVWASDYNTEIIKEFRANQGRVGGPWAGITLILIHHIGARSGVERVTPVAYHPQPGGRFAIWAANGGIAHPPELGPQPQGPPRDHRRGWCPGVHGPGAGAGRHRPRRAVADAGLGIPPARRSPGQDHAAVSGVRADPPGLTRDENPACAMIVLRGSRPANVERVQCAHAAWWERHPRSANSAQAAASRGRRSSRGPATGTRPAQATGLNAQLPRRQP
jgi:hypothetical protein